jgi:TolB protein
LVSGGAANDTFSASADQLVYPLYDNNRLVLYTSQSDGSEQHRLKLAGQALVWNRDGSKIAYLNQSEGAVQIFYTQFSDTEIVQLTNTPNHKRALNWSPTGSQLAFLQEEGKGDVLYVIDSNDPKPRSFRVFQQGTTLGFSWHPDGQSLLFAQKIGDAARVYQVNAERTDLKQLTNFESYDPAWAPDGAHFAVASIQGLMVINVDGEKRRQLVEGEVHHPLWDYNGREIAYLTPSKRPAASQNLLYDLWLISSDGSTPSQKIVEDVLNFAWSPNSPRLAYVTGVLQTSGASRLYLWTVASGEQPRLVAETSDPFIAWVP